MALLFMKDKGWTIEKVEAWLGSHPQYAQTPTEQPTMLGVQNPPKTETPKPLGEAIIDSSEPLPHDLISRKEVLNISKPYTWVGS